MTDLLKPRRFDRPRFPSPDHLRRETSAEASLVAESDALAERCGSLANASAFVFVVAPILDAVDAIHRASYVVVAAFAFVGFAGSLVALSIRVGRITVGVEYSGDIAHMLSRLRAKERWSFYSSWVVGLALAGLAVSALAGT